MLMVEDIAPKAGDEGRVVAKAAVNAAQRLGVSAQALGDIIGLSSASVSRMKAGALALQRGTKPFELALMFVRLFRSLDAIAGGDEAVAARWMVSDNSALGGRPLDKIKTITGLTDVIAYLDARRALV